MNRRTYLGAVAGSTFLAGAGGSPFGDRVVGRDGSDGGRLAERQTNGTGTTSASTPGTETTGAASFGPRTFSGRGTSTTGEFELSPGPIVAEFFHDGESNFISELLTVEGESYEDVALTNLIGTVEGAQVRSVSAPGAHVLNVDADGEWEITLTQSASPEVRSLPQTASGTGPSVVAPIGFEGLTRAEGTHEGASNFIVEAVPLDPEAFGSLVFNEIGEFDGATTARIPRPSYLNVAADGEWSLSLSA
ncbi:hypothetical protein [Halobaculum rarum]|uniref:hypothetical protein n=1 Tax=Halobaculum rarum TaxID=3075122 RepID=UPI0032AF2566